MSAIEPLSRVVGVNPNQLSEQENWILESALLIPLCAELKTRINTHYHNYFCLLKISNENEKEHLMLDDNFIAEVIKDIVATGEYSLKGIAYYTQIPLDLLYEVMLGRASLSLTASLKIMELHRSVRPGLYRAILQKAVQECTQVA